MGNQAGKERLSKADVEFLKTNTRYDEDTIQQWYKGFMSDCPDGKLNPEMFIKVKQMMNSSHCQCTVE